MKSVVLTAVFFLISVEVITPQKMGDSYTLNVNNISLPINNTGVLAEVGVPTGPGGRFAGQVFLFSGGFYLSGTKNDTVWANAVASASLEKNYLPGIVTVGSGDPRAQIYRIRSDDQPFGQSWQDWGDAVELDADFYDGDGDGIYNPVDLNANGKWDTDEDRPDLIGDEMLWCVYYDGLPADQRYWMGEPQGIEIQQTIFAYSDIPSLSNIFFIRYRIKYTGLNSNDPEYLNSVYFGIWDDPDIGYAEDDLVGCDTLTQGGFVYNNGPDNIYGSNPPSLFETVLAGPPDYIPGVTFIDNNGNGIFDEGDTAIDTAYVNNGQILGVKIYPGAENQRFSSSINYLNGDPVLRDPQNQLEARNLMLGLDVTGEIVNPCTWIYGQVRGGVDCSAVNPYFWYSGDPILNYGWIFTIPSSVRQLNNLGPFKLKKGENSDIYLAYSIDQGTDALSSITAAKNIAEIAQKLYNANFDTAMVTSVKELPGKNVPEKFSLSQNYPNPFNPTTTIKYSVPAQLNITIKIFDILGNEVETLINEEKSAGTYELNWDAAKLPSEVYIYQLRAGTFVDTKKMILLK